MRTSIEVADIFRSAGPAYRAAHAGHLSLGQLKVMTAIETCRTAAPGGHVEACDDCGHYLKIVHSDRDPFVEPVADDLASVTLDLLVSDAGWRRHGLNLLMWFGEPPPDPGAG